MGKMTTIAATIAVLAACSDEPEPIIIAGEGTAPQAELARLDSAVVDTLGAIDTLEEVSLAEEQPPAPRESPPAVAAPAEPAPAAPEPEPEPVEPEPEPVEREPATPPADTAFTAPPPDPAPTESTASTDSAPAAPEVSVPEPEPEPVPPTEAPAPAPSSPPDTVAAASSEAAPAPRTNRGGVVPAGTSIHAALDDSLSSRRDSAGQVVTARVMQHVTDAVGKVFIPAGAVVQLTLTELEPAGSRTAADGKLAMRVDGIRMGDGLRKVQAEVQSIPHELKGRGVTGSEAAKVGAGTVAGAVAGRVIGGKKNRKKGTIIGAVVGAAAGAATAAQTADRDVVVKARTPIVLVLKAPLVATDGR